VDWGDLAATSCDELAEHAVRVLDIGAPGVCHPADLRDLNALRAGLRDIEVVVHLGGIDRSVTTDDAATMQVNVMGTWNLFEASLQCVSAPARDPFRLPMLTPAGGANPQSHQQDDCSQGGHRRKPMSIDPNVKSQSVSMR
jgi:hypothetical protein